MVERVNVGALRHKHLNFQGQDRPFVPAIRTKFPDDGYRLSVSRSQLFEKCPKAFNLSYNEKLDLPADTEAMDMGKEIHDVLYWVSFFANPEVLRTHKLYDDYAVHFENYIGWSRKRGCVSPVFAEKEIYDEEFKFLLYIDRLDYIEGEYELIDYKTGGYHPIIFHRLQLATYCYFLKKHYNIDVDRWTIFYTREGKEVSEKVNKWMVEMIPYIFQEVRERMQSCSKKGNFPLRESVMCKFCVYKQWELCYPQPFNPKTTPFNILDIFSSWGRDFLEVKKSKSGAVVK